MKCRRFIVTMLLTMIAGQSWALGLGELDLQSALNERFKANIELYDAAALELSEIRVSLASAKDFDRVGVERFFFLTTLDFEVVEGARGMPEIRVTSSQPISEPYLDFVVEVLWPNGRLLREYTVLLDPPTFTQAAAPPVSAPARTPPEPSGGASGTRAPSPSRTTAPSRPTAARAVSGPRRSAVSGGQTYRMTIRNDTLWEIAQNTMPAQDITIQQNMLAIKRLNPRAFIDDNINKLKAGYVLRTPTAAEARALSPEQALQRVVQENEAWRSGRRLRRSEPSGADSGEFKAQIDATREAQEPAPVTTVTEGQLRIVAEAGDNVQGTADAENDTGVAGNGSGTTEEQERLARELDAVNYKMDRELEKAAADLAFKDRQIDIKDRQLTELQAQLGALREEMERLEAERALAPAPAAAAEQPWWQSGTTLGAGVLGLALLAGGGALLARRRREAADYGDASYEEESYSEETFAFVPEPAVGGAETVAVVDDRLVVGEDEEAEAPVAADHFGVVAPLEDTEREDSIASVMEEEREEDEEEEEREREYEQREEEDSSEASTSDVVGEAEIYIAYGRYPQAVTLLTGTLDADPGRHDVRCKLLELYAETNDRDAFEAQYTELSSSCDDQQLLDVAESLRGGFDELGEVALDDLQLAPDESFDERSQDDELPDLDSDAASADGFELELDPVPYTGGQDDSGASSNGEDFELDLDLSLDDGPGDAQTAEADSGDLDVVPVTTASHSDQLGGDLGLDFDPDRESATAGLSGAGLDDDLMSLDDVIADSDDGRHDPASGAAGELSAFDTPASEAADSFGEVETVSFEKSAGAAEEDLDFELDGDGASTKLDLARAYLDMGEQGGARDILKEVLSEGSEEQRQEAQEMLDKL